jgi:hypothetical protein
MHGFGWRRGWFCTLFACLVITSAPPVRANGPVGLEAITQFDRLCELRPGVRTEQYSSHDPTGGNDDNNNYLQIDGNERVMLDVQGPGCIYRIWYTVSDFHADGSIRIYFDNETTPTVVMSQKDFFWAETAPFLWPLVGRHHYSSGGYYCYVPMPFREACKITHTNHYYLNYHNITYHRYPSADGITTFTGQESVDDALAVWNATGSDPKVDQGSITETGTADVLGHATVTLADIQSAGTIQQILLDMPGISEYKLASLRLKIYWDDDTEPAVDAPLGMMFGSGLGTPTVDALPVGMNGTQLYCYFPMPFDSRARIQLTNTTGFPVYNLACTIRYSQHGEPRPGVGKFHTKHRRTYHPVNGQDVMILDENNGGHLVGVVQTFRGYSSNQWYLEGDERVYIDGELTPSLYGTGVEDFYNGGWYFYFGDFTLPVHGCPVEINADPARHACYRYFISDPITWSRDIYIGQEHGGHNQFDADFESLALYYKASQPLSQVTDELDIGDSSSEASHNYQITGQSWSGSTTASHEGDHDDVDITDDGRRLSATGTSEFTLAISPLDNAGVVLRRRLDYSIARQKARVYVDDQLAGIWYDAGENNFFADSEFSIPKIMTVGKTQLTIRIENASTESAWSEYYYQASTLLPIVPAVDTDHDGIADELDNCPTTANQDQADIDQDGMGDACDDDADNDSVLNGADNCWLTQNPDQTDSDNDGVGDACDICPDTLTGLPVDDDGCSAYVPGDLDRDGDVDQKDFGLMQTCIEGIGTPPSSGMCEAADLDGDIDVDGADMSWFIQCISGPRIQGDPACVSN